jgi:TonB family protein
VSYNEWLDIDVLEDYLDGKLDAKTMYRVEKLSLEDPFVAEALEGLSKSPKRTQTLSLLQKQLQERIAQKPIEKKRWTITSHRLSIAAAAAVLFVTVSILFWMKENNHQQMSAKEKAKKIDVTIAPQVATTQQISPAAPVAIDKASANAYKVKLTREKSIGNGNSVITKVPEVAIQVTNAPVIKPVSDSIAVDANSARVAAANIALTKVKAEESKVVAKKRIENPRETALPSKVDGIYLESGGITEKQKESIINGRVYSKNDRQPMPGVTVVVNGSNKATTTNNRGEFTLPVDSNSAQSLSIAYVGFTTKVVNTHSNQSVNVELEESQNKLNEVVVLDKYKKEVTTALVYSPTAAYYPLGGWQDYQSYLLNNNNLTKNGLTGKEVILTFEVKPNGNPTNITVVKSEGKVMDKEAVRLLNDGPKWLPIDKSKKGTSQVAIKF